MSKIKGKLLNMFSKDTQKVPNTAGKLEADAVPVDDDAEINGNRFALQPSSSSTPTASADMTAAVVRELSDPNYNSLDLVSTSDALAMPAPGVGATSNTMNVHNAQQQVVMQFSNISNLHFGNSYNINNIGESCAGVNGKGDAAPDVTDVRQKPRKTTSIVAMMQSKDEPNHRMLDTISTHLGKGWKKVMRDLGHSEGQIQQAMIDHQQHGDIKEVIYQLLLQWVRNADDDLATLGFITTLLWQSNHRDCVQRMKLVWKTEAMTSSRANTEQKV